MYLSPIRSRSQKEQTKILKSASTEISIVVFLWNKILIHAIFLTRHGVLCYIATLGGTTSVITTADDALEIPVASTALYVSADSDNRPY